MTARVAVVTACGRAPLDVLRRCHESVRAQGVADHWMVWSGDAPPESDSWAAKHIRLPIATDDCTARALGGLLAQAGGHDFIAWLDAQNHYQPGHLDALLKTQGETGSMVVASLRTLHRPDGSALPFEEQPRPGDALDINTLLLARPAFALAETWQRIPRNLGAIAGRIFFRALENAGLQMSLAPHRGVAVTARDEALYRAAGEAPPAGTCSNAAVGAAYAWLLQAEGVARSTEALGFWPVSDADMALRGAGVPASPATARNEDIEFRVAVITPYYREPLAMLRQCHESVRAPRHIEVVHFLVADGHPQAQIDGWKARHVKLPVAHGDNGNTPRAVGSLLAAAEGFDFIAYLDADNWYHPGHLESLVELHETSGADVCCAQRTYHRADGSALPLTERSEDSGQHVDTSGLLLHRRAFPAASLWHRMPRALSPICDRVFLRGLKHLRHTLAHSGERSVAFRTQYASHYAAVKEAPPAGAKTDDAIKPVLQYLYSPAGIRESVASLGFWPGADPDEQKTRP